MDVFPTRCRVIWTPLTDYGNEPISTMQSALQLIITVLAGVTDWSSPELALAIALQVWVYKVPGNKIADQLCKLCT